MLPSHISEKDTSKRRTAGAKKKVKEMEREEKEESVPSGLFHPSTLGTTLIQTLNDAVEQGKMSKETASAILDNFDNLILKNFDKEMSKQPQILPTAEVTAELLNYNRCRSDWRIDATNVQINFGSEKLHAKDGRFLFRMREN